MCPLHARSLAYCRAKMIILALMPEPRELAAKFAESGRLLVYSGGFNPILFKISITLESLRW